MFILQKLKTGQLFVFLIFLLLIISCTSKTEMKGKVVDIQQNPIVGAEIRFVKINPDSEDYFGEIRSTTITDENGEFKLIPEDMGKGDMLGLIVIKEGFNAKPIQLRISEIEKFNEVFQDYLIIIKKDE